MTNVHSNAPGCYAQWTIPGVMHHQNGDEEVNLPGIRGVIRTHDENGGVEMRPLGLLVFLSLMLGSTAAAPRPRRAMAPLTPAVTATRAIAPPPPTAVPAPVVFTNASIGSHLVEDTDGDGKVSAADRTEIVTLVELVIWGNITASPVGFGQAPPASDEPGAAPFEGWVIDVLSAADGSFAFKNLPAGDYSLSVWWAGGFVHGATVRLPDLYRAVFRVETDGRITVPSPLPATWPESFGGEPLDPVLDHVPLGGVPDVLLLKTAPKNTVPYPVGGSGISGRGSFDVGAAFAGRPAPAPRLPTAGGGASRGFDTSWWLLAAALSLSLGIAAVGVHMRRR